MGKGATDVAVGAKVHANYDGTEFIGYVLAVQSTPDGTTFLCAYLENQDGVLTVLQLWVGATDFAVIR